MKSRTMAKARCGAVAPSVQCAIWMAEGFWDEPKNASLRKGKSIACLCWRGICFAVS
jgi:hypothetical protein